MTFIYVADRRWRSQGYKVWGFHGGVQVEDIWNFKVILTYIKEINGEKYIVLVSLKKTTIAY